MTTTESADIPSTERTVLITGANKGLGLEAARTLAERGWTVWLGSRDLARGQQAAAGLDGDVRPIQLDVTDETSVTAAVGTVAAAGGLRVLINNAGIIGSARPTDEISVADFVSVYGTNLLGPVRMTQAFLPLLRQAVDPRIVMVSSGLGSIEICATPGSVESRVTSLTYPSSKAALNMLTFQYAKAYPELTIVAVDPGYTATDLNGNSGHQTVAQGAAVLIDSACAETLQSGTFRNADGLLPW